MTRPRQTCTAFSNRPPHSLGASWSFVIALFVATSCVGIFATHANGQDQAAGSAIDRDAAVVRVDGVGKATLRHDATGRPVYVFTDHAGQRQTLGPDAFSTYVMERQREQSWLYLALNISSPWGVAWVALGLAGQVLFTGRMLVQWLVSERARRSVVPPVFWWMSLVGASMLLAYFLWRRDIVGVLGQGAGWLIYARNLALIHREPAAHAPPTPPARPSRPSES